MTRSSETCEGCGCQLDERDATFCAECRSDGTAIRLSGFEAARERCLVCRRLISSDGSCGCSEGCAPDAARKGSALEWVLLVGAILAVAVLVAERLMWL